MRYFIGLDLGSSAVKAVLLQGDGKIVDVRNQKIEFLDQQDPDILEIDSTYYYETIFHLIKELCCQVERIDAISWVTAGGSLILFDSYQNQLSQIISWMDKRSLQAAERLPDYGITYEQYYKVVGWPFSPHFPLGKLIWLREAYPETFSRISRVCMTNDLLGFKLTNTWLIDNSTAETMSFFDQEAIQLKEDFVESIGLRNENFPEIRYVGSQYGDISVRGIESTHLQKSTKIILGSFDHPGAARAIGLKEKNQLLLSCGTSWVVCQVLPEREFGLEKGYLIDPYTQSEEGGHWFGMVSVSRLGTFFNHWAEAISAILFGTEAPNRFGAIDSLASRSDPQESHPVFDILVTTPSLEYVSQLIKSSSEYRVARSLLESVVFCVKRRLNEKGIDLHAIDEVFLAGGPAESVIWPQIIADVFQTEVKVSYGKYAGAVGAAKIAASGIGVHLDTSEVRNVCFPNRANKHAIDQRFERFLYTGGA